MKIPTYHNRLSIFQFRINVESILVVELSNPLFFWRCSKFAISFSAVPFPPSNKLTQAEVFNSRTNKPLPEVLKQHFILEGRIGT